MIALRSPASASPKNNQFFFPRAVTAAHCSPFFPPCHGASYTEERTYQALLAPLGSEPSVWAECLFADPIADLAVLGSPDNQVLFDEADAYEALVDDLPSFRI